MVETHRIPLFPLGVVLLPDMLLPLHIFEERYKQMMAHCLAEDAPFGIVLFDGQSIRSVGCLARVTKVLKRYDDGRMDILTRGGARFVIQELIEQRAYLEAKVFFFDDAGDPSEDDLTHDVADAWKLLDEMAAMELDIDAAAFDRRIPPRRLSFAIAALDGFSPAERQGFLEMTATAQRLKKSVQALSRIVSRNRLTREIQQVIGGNGHPPHSILRKLEAEAED